MSKLEDIQPDDGAAEFRAPLSSAQRSFWFAHALNPDGSAYNVSLAWRIQVTSGRTRSPTRWPM